MIRRALFATALGLPLAACLLDLPTPKLIDPDGGLPDGFVPADTGVPDGTALNDASDAGMDGTAMPDGGGLCDGGPCLFHAVNDPHLIDNDGTNLYFVDGSYDIVKLNIVNKTPTPLSANTNDFILDFKVRGQTIFFTTFPMSTSNNASSCPTSGCGSGSARTNYMPSNPSKWQAFGVDSDGANVFFSLSEVLPNGGILKCAVGSPCANNTPWKALDLTQKLIVNGGSVYFTNANTMGIYSCPTTTCGTPANAMGNSIKDIAVDSANMYWVQGNGVVFRQPKGMTAVQLATSVGNAKAIRSDGTNVYWLCETALFRCPANVPTCVPVVMAQGLMRTEDLTITNDSVFFTTRSPSGGIWRLPK